MSVACTFADAQRRFEGHFPRRAVIPGATLLDRAILEIEHATARRVTGVRQMKFSGSALPGERLMLSAAPADSLVRFEFSRNGQTVCAGVLALEQPV